VIDKIIIDLDGFLSKDQELTSSPDITIENKIGEEVCCFELNNEDVVKIVCLLHEIAINKRINIYE